jgi:hypothetical protein
VAVVSKKLILKMAQLILSGKMLTVAVIWGYVTLEPT